jgi:hypothetical protein
VHCARRRRPHNWKWNSKLFPPWTTSIPFKNRSHCQKKKKTLFFFPEESLAQTFNVHKFTLFSSCNHSKVDVLEERIFLKAKNILPVHGIWNWLAPVDSLTLEIYMTRNTNHNSLVSTRPSQAKTRCQFQLPNYHWTRYFDRLLLVFQFWGSKVLVGYGPHLTPTLYKVMPTL